MVDTIPQQTAPQRENSRESVSDPSQAVAGKVRQGFTPHALLLIGVLLIGLWLGGGVLLWFGQGRHNRQGLELEIRSPGTQISQPGEMFASALIVLMKHELQSGFGWRPNDFFLWGPTLGADDNANRQLGVLQVVRESTRVFKDHLTKVSSNEFDPDLLEADTLFRNDATKFWFPSAESRYTKAMARLENYSEGLQQGSQRSKPITVRNVELIRLFQAWTDLLGDAHANLYRDIEADGTSTWWKSDDYFYRAQGYAHGMAVLLKALTFEYQRVLDERSVMRDLFKEAGAALEKAARLNPLVIMSGSPSGLFANHRRNLDAYITEARQNMYSIREELEK